MSPKAHFRQIGARVLFFFPFQLVLLHLKKNHLTLLCWLVFFGYITQNVGVKYGIPYVFLFPEYFGTANPWSFLLLGFSLGGFITAFNLFTVSLALPLLMGRQVSRAGRLAHEARQRVRPARIAMELELCQQLRPGKAVV